MAIIEHQGKKIALDCRWTHCQSLFGAREVLRSSDLSYSKVVRSQDGSFTLVEANQKSISAALVLAKHNPNSLSVYQLDEDEFYYCFVVDGFVFQGNDVVLSRDELMTRINANEQGYDGVDLIACVSNSVDIFGSVSCFRNVVELTEESFIHILTRKGQSLSPKAITLAKLYKRELICLAIAFVLALVMGIAFNTLNDLQVVPVVVGKAPADASKAKLQALLQFAPAADNIKELRKYLRGINAKTSGWQVKKVKCDFQNHQCQLDYTIVDMGDNAQFNMEFKAQKPKLEYNTKNAHVVANLKVDAVARSAEHLYQQLPTQAHFLSDEMSTLQFINKTKLVKVSVEPPRISTAGAYAHRAGKIKINGKGLFTLFALTEELGSNVVAKILEVNFDKDLKAKWKIGGHYVIKN